MALRATLHAAVNAFVALTALCAPLQVEIEANVLALALWVTTLKGFWHREVRRLRGPPRVVLALLRAIFNHVFLATRPTLAI